MTNESSPLLPARRSRLRRFIFALAVILTLIVLFYAEENWRGKRAWENYKRERIAKGESFDRSSLDLPRVPDDQNFYKTPLLETAGYRIQTNKPYHFSLSPDSISSGNYPTGKRTKLLDYYDRIRDRGNYSAPATPLEPAADVVRLFNEHPDIDELRKASLRPYSMCKPLENPLISEPIPNFVTIRCYVDGFTVLCSAELKLGESENAFNDARVILKFADALQGNPTLVSAMMRVSVVGLYTQTFWEGWADQRWTDKHYEAFQTNFLSPNLFADSKRAFQGERVGVTMLIEDMANKVRGSKLFDHQTSLAFKAAPTGWYYQNLLNYHRPMETALAGVDVVRKTYDPAVANASFQHLNKFLLETGPFRILCRIAIPNYTRACSTCARVQAFANMAAIVCGLERFRHAEGHYPSNLDELSPKFISTIPMDVIGGEPFHYHVTAKGFQLYSVGLDGKDDGGTPAKADVGDWVWMYPVES